MSTSNPEVRQGGLNPQALSPEELARVLSAVGIKPVTLDIIQADLAAGAPQNADGSINLVNYAAWLVREVTRGD